MIDRKIKYREVYMTNSLGNMLKEWERTLPKDQYNRVMTDIAMRISGIQYEVSKLPPGKERAKWAHRYLQNLIDKEKTSHSTEFEAKVQCKMGCAGCCHQQVEISGDEADLLASIVKNGTKIDMEKTERLAGKHFHDKDLGWWRQPQEEKACLFLDQQTGKCRIYANRPMACRKYFVFTPPEKCSEVSEVGSITVGVYGIPEAEIAATAIMDYVRGEGNMPKLLWDRLKEKGNA